MLVRGVLAKRNKPTSKATAEEELEQPGNKTE